MLIIYKKERRSFNDQETGALMLERRMKEESVRGRGEARKRRRIDTFFQSDPRTFLNFECEPKERKGRTNWSTKTKIKT
jgi:hypothetical protein